MITNVLLLFMNHSVQSHTDAGRASVDVMYIGADEHQTANIGYDVM